MIVFIDGENFRQNLVSALIKHRVIRHRDVMFDYDVEGLLREALMREDLDIRYYASEVKLPRDHEVGAEILAQVEKIERKSRRWEAVLVERGIKYIRAGNLKVRLDKKCRNCGAEEEVFQERGSMCGWRLIFSRRGLSRIATRWRCFRRTWIFVRRFGRCAGME